MLHFTDSFVNTMAQMVQYNGNFTDGFADNETTGQNISIDTGNFGTQEHYMNNLVVEEFCKFC